MVGELGAVTDVYYESNNQAGFRADQRFSVEEPALTLMARGMGGDALNHWRIVTHGSSPRPSAGPVKPPYRVPSMAEIAAVPWNGLTVASTFSGCGGSCLGYRLAGYRVVWASEFVPIAAESYRANAPETILDTRDIRTVTADEILEAAGLAVGELDLLDGSPPCQPFSTAGKRHKTWGQVREYGDHRQRADDLFYEYVRLVDGLRPRTFVAENVSGLVKGSAKGYFKRILARLKACGYRVRARLCDAQWLGVPQARLRVIFVGVREDLGRDPVFPTPLAYRYSVRDALPWLGSASGHFGYGPGVEAVDLASPMPTIAASEGTRGRLTTEMQPAGDGFAHAYRGGLDAPAGTVRAGRGVGVEQRVVHDTGGAWGTGDVTDRPSPTVTVGRRSQNASHFQVETVAAPSPTVPASSRGRSDIAPSRLPAFDGQVVYGLTIVDPEKPSPTVTSASPGNDVAPPVERRKFTIGEVKRLCAFPDDFELVGSYGEQWARLGNAVPPVMMQHIAAAVRDGVLLPAGAEGR